MNVHVEENRFLSVACEPGERIVFDRKETRYHLLRESAARLWDEIGEGGTFELSPPDDGAEDPVTLLVEAGLVEPAPAAGAAGVSRRVWLRRTGKASAAALVLPLVATISAPKLALGQGLSLDEQVESSSTTQFQPLDEPEILPPLTPEQRRQQRSRRRPQDDELQERRRRRRNRDG